MPRSAENAAGEKKPLAIHPSLKEIKDKDKQVVMDQPCCAFVPHTVALREGQELVQKDGKYLPLTAAVVREGRQKLD